MQSETKKVTLRMAFNAGVVDGKQKVTHASFSRLVLTAADDALYDTAKALANCYTAPLLAVTKIEETALSDGAEG